MASLPLPRCTPEEAGLPSRQLTDCIQALNHDLTTMNGFMAARHGKVFAECWWAPYGAELVHSNHSLGKSYTATAIGIALKEGRLSLDEKMTDVFADEIAERGIAVPDLLKRITIRHVMTMTNGMAHHPSMSGDWIGNYFRTPMAFEPGTRFAYNSSGSCMLGAIILKRTGQNMKDYLAGRLFTKIGVDPEHFVWLQFPNQIDAEPGTFSRTEDNLRLAMLYCSGGRWNNEQILDPEFVRSALSVQVTNPYAPEQKDGRCGYGYRSGLAVFLASSGLTVGRASTGSSGRRRTWLSRSMRAHGSPWDRKRPLMSCMTTFSWRSRTSRSSLPRMATRLSLSLNPPSN